MTTKKAKAAKSETTVTNDAAVKRNEAALNTFPKRAIVDAMNTMAGFDQTSQAAQADRGNAAMELLIAVRAYAHEAMEITDVDTIVGDYRENLRLVALELATANHPFAKLIPATDDKPARGQLTGYGANVASIAKGVIEHDIEIAEGDSYSDVRTAVQHARKESADPAVKQLREAKEACDKVWSDLRKEVFKTKSIEHIEALTLAVVELAEAYEQRTMPEETQGDTTEAEAEAKSA